MEVLQKAAEGKISLQDLKVESSKFRVLTGLKAAFVKTTNCTIWDEAQEKYPAYASEEKLWQFGSLNFKAGLPSVFRDYCQSAINSVTSCPSSESTCIYSNESRMNFLHGSLTNFTGVEVAKKIPTFTGGNLVLGHFKKVCKRLLVILHGHYNDLCMYIHYFLGIDNR